MEREELVKVVETLLFITDQPIEMKKLCKITEVGDEAVLRDALAELQRLYLETGRAIQVMEVGGGWQLTTKPEYGRWVRKLYNEKLTLRLSAAALETLAIIAYRQPITRAEIEVIRGVEVIAPLETLVTRGLVKVAGRKETVGRPLLYGTSEDFLRLFGLNNLDGLPKIDTLALEKAQAQADLQPAPSNEPTLFNENGEASTPAETPAQEVPQEPAPVDEQQPFGDTALPPEQPAASQETQTVLQDEQPQSEPPQPQEAQPATQNDEMNIQADPLVLEAEPPLESLPLPETPQAEPEAQIQIIEEDESLFEAAGVTDTGSVTDTAIAAGATGEIPAEQAEKDAASSGGQD